MMRIRATRLGVMSSGRRVAVMPFPLDGVEAVTAVSLHLLRSGYVGPLIRVRRSTDNAEQDFGIKPGARYVDWQSVLSFCGAGGGFLVTAYDQTGAGLHFTQSTAAYQMQVVSAGVFIGGLLVVSQSHAVCAAVPINSSSGYTVLAVETDTPVNAVTSNVAASFTVNNVNGAREWVGTMPGGRVLGHRPAGGAGNVAYSGGGSLDTARTVLRLARRANADPVAWINGGDAGVGYGSGSYAGPTVPVSWGNSLDVNSNQTGAKRQALIILSGSVSDASAAVVEQRLLALSHIIP